MRMLAQLSLSTIQNGNEETDLTISSPPLSDEYSFEQPIIENASRASTVLYNIARAHAFEIHGRNYIKMEEGIPIAIKIALSSANRNRVSVLRYMITETRFAI